MKMKWIYCMMNNTTLWHRILNYSSLGSFLDDLLVGVEGGVFCFREPLRTKKFVRDRLRYFCANRHLM